jgi:hypothetical protein
LLLGFGAAEVLGGLGLLGDLGHEGVVLVQVVVGHQLFLHVVDATLPLVLVPLHQ